uniref:Uncharacterized protein n=2 Tax=Oryza TaxID=4527 RepID=A0A0E0MYY3_ORYRU
MVPNKPLRTIEVLEITEEEAVGREEDLLALAQLAGILAFIFFLLSESALVKVHLYSPFAHLPTLPVV